MFTDKYIDQESNEKLRELIFDFLTTSHSVRFAPSDHDDIDVRFFDKQHNCFKLIIIILF